MIYKQTTMKEGGLMRCCVETIQTFCDEHADEESVDQTMDCEYEQSRNRQIRLKDGVWSWNTEEFMNATD